MSIASEIEQALTGTPDPKPSEFLSTGSSTLNMACSGKTTGGLRKGLYYLLVGDTNTGKTTLTMTLFAEAANNPAFDDYRLEHVNAEHGALMDVARHFGQKTADRINETTPETLEEFYDYMDGLVEDSNPFIAVLDSMDALVPAGVIKRHRKGKKAREKGDEEKGSYNTEKPRINSDRLRTLCAGLQKTQSILVIISQTRQKLGFGAQYDPKTFSGGDALTFYARLQLWTKLKRNIRKRIKGIDREIGKDVEVKVKKNHLTGWEGKLGLRLYRLLIDDLGTMITWLIEEGHWTEKRAKTSPAGTGKVVAPEFGWSGPVEGLVRKIEEGNKEGKLRKIVRQVWQEIESASQPKRKRRYT